MKKLILGLSILSLSCQAGFGDLIKGMGSSIAKVAAKSCKSENIATACFLTAIAGFATWMIFDALNHKKHADSHKAYINNLISNITKLAALETLTFSQKQTVYYFYVSVREFKGHVQKLNVKKHAAYINQAMPLIEQAEELLKKFDIKQLCHDVRPVYVGSQETTDKSFEQQQRWNNYYFMQQKAQKTTVSEKPGYCYNCEDWFTKKDNHSPKTCGQ